MTENPHSNLQNGEREESPKTIATGMTLADISIRNHVFAWILMIALIGFGLLVFTGYGDVMRGLGIGQAPTSTSVVNVSVTYEGASPEIMEPTLWTSSKTR
jgi:multidrug efflux pump subunit AcrB